MTKVRFLANHDLNHHIVSGVLRAEPTITFIRAREVGLHEISDEELLEYAANEKLALVSHDVNTMIAAWRARHRNKQPLSGLFLIPQRAAIAEAIADLCLIWTLSEAAEWNDIYQYLPF